MLFYRNTFVVNTEVDEFAKIMHIFMSSSWDPSKMVRIRPDPRSTTDFRLIGGYQSWFFFNIVFA